MVVQVFSQTILAALVLAGPPLAAALISGVVITIAEAATGIQESTLTFVPKLIFIVGSFIVFGPMQLAYLVAYTQNILSSIALGAR